MFGKYFKTKTPPSKELKQALKDLGWPIKAEEVVNAARTVMVICAAVFVMLAVIALLVGINVIIFIIGAAVFPILLNQILTDYPKSLSKQRAITALGAAPNIIAQLSINLKQNPNLEHALSFVAKYGEGDIARDIRKFLWKVWSGKIPSTHDVLTKLAEKWGRWSEGVQRSLHLIIASFHERSRKRKLGSLDRAVESVLTDIVMKMREYTLALHIPTLVLFSFGIIMPLMVVALFPLLGFFGIPMGVETITLFLFASLLGAYLYSNNILAKRPVTFILPEIKTSVPKGYLNLRGTIVPALPFCAAIALIMSAPGLLYLISLFKTIQITGPLGLIINWLNTMPIIWGCAIAIALYYWGTNWFKREQRKQIKEVEAQLPDALYYMRNVMSEGRPLEEALDFASGMLGKSKLGDQTKRATKLIKERHIAIEEVLVGRESPFDRRSKQLQAVLSILATSMRGGIKAAAESCDVMYNYMRKIKEVERSLIEMLSRNLAMMRLTAVLFAPLVAAIIVVLFALIVKSMSGATEQYTILGYAPMTAISAPSIPTPVLQLILGLYAIGLNYVLIRYVTTIYHGTDSVQLGLELSQSILIALVLFTTTLIALSSLLLGG